MQSFSIVACFLLLYVVAVLECAVGLYFYSERLFRKTKLLWIVWFTSLDLLLLFLWCRCQNFDRCGRCVLALIMFHRVVVWLRDFLLVLCLAFFQFLRRSIVGSFCSWFCRLCWCVSLRWFYPLAAQTLCVVSGWVHVVLGNRGVPLYAPFLLRCLVHMVLGATRISCWLSELLLSCAFAYEFSRVIVVKKIVCRILISFLWLFGLSSENRCVTIVFLCNWHCAKLGDCGRHGVFSRCPLVFGILWCQWCRSVLLIYVHLRRQCFHCFLLLLRILFLGILGNASGIIDTKYELYIHTLEKFTQYKE